jgi:flagellar biosynthetic protein FliR
LYVTILGEPVLAYLLASLRIVTWLVVVPPFSTRAVPTMAKVVLSLGLALTVAPALAETSVPLTLGPLLVSVVTQVATGAALGFLTSLMFAAVAAAGSLIDVFGGFALAQGFDPLGQQGSTIFGTFHQWLFTMLLFASGGHLLVIGGLLRTFDLMPVGDTPDVGGGSDLLVNAFSLFVVIAVQVALPMIAVLFVADLGLALMTKVAPALNALNVMFPAKIGLTLILLGLSFPVLITVTERVVDHAMRAMAAFSGG